MPKLSDVDHSAQTVCPFCFIVHDQATGLDSDDGPSEGAFSVCIRCGNIAIFDVDLNLRPVQSDDLTGLTVEQRKKLIIASIAAQSVEHIRKMREKK